MTADSKCGFYVIYYQRMRWLLIVPRFQEPQKLEKRRMKESNLQVVSDWLVSNQIQYHYGNTAYWLDESSFNYASDAEEHQPYTIKTRGIKSFFKATHLKKLVEMESNHPNPKTSDLQSEPLPLRDIHQCRRCVFTELSSPIKQVPWFFMCIPTTALTFGYSL